jgi:hypothetical protein
MPPRPGVERLVTTALAQRDVNVVAETSAAQRTVRAVSMSVPARVKGLREAVRSMPTSRLFPVVATLARSAQSHEPNSRS